jgi:hypothetical protein
MPGFDHHILDSDALQPIGLVVPETKRTVLADRCE